jgi:hypothetical protein
LSDPKDEGDAFRKARTGRNVAILVGLLAFVALVFVITIVKLSGNVVPPAG